MSEATDSTGGNNWTTLFQIDIIDLLILHMYLHALYM